MEEIDLEWEDAISMESSVEISVYSQSGKPEKPVPKSQKWNQETCTLTQVFGLCEFLHKVILQ